MKKSPNTLGRLLEEISWEGNARHYREGGRGFENVLTAEVFQALDLLPRSAFLGRVIATVKGGSRDTVGMFAAEVEQAAFTLLPGSIMLSERSPEGESALAVQPDGIIATPGVCCLVEAKRLRQGSFQPEQLARELLAVIQEADGRKPLILLVLPYPPPIPVKGYGRLTLPDAVAPWLERVVARADGEFGPADELLSRVDEIIGFTTWEQIGASVEAGIEDFAKADESIRASVGRLSQAVLQAIEWHS